MPARHTVPARLRRLADRGVLAWAIVALAAALLPAVAQAQEAGDNGVTAARVQGLTRFETAARIADLSFDQAEVAVLVTGYDFPDALAGSFAAGVLDAPILLVEPDNVPESTFGMLGELGVSRVVLLGGTAAIGEEVERELDEQGYPSTRVSGEDRYRTAAEVATRYGPDAAALLDGDRTAVLASGQVFADALAAGPLVAHAELPLLLTPTHDRLDVVDQALQELDIDRVLVVGGQEAVSDAVAAHYHNSGYTVERLEGATRDQTAAVVADRVIGAYAHFTAEAVLLARGDDFPDALAASMHGAALGAPILLTAAPDVLGDATRAWLERRCPAIDVVRALGGRGAVTAGTLGEAVEAAERCLRPTDEVSRFTTPLLGNPDRTHNIHLAADYIDGDTIMPGASYSLNQGIGRRTRARGFREVDNGCIGAGGEPVDCVGGGVSQMGTTFLNAAWFAGVELVDFRQHSIYFQRYPVCHEATLSWGSLDVVIHNDSPYKILIDAFYTDEFIGVRFVSREWAQVSSWAEPQNPPSSGSFTSRCGRTITYPDGTSRDEAYRWTYDDTGF